MLTGLAATSILPFVPSSGVAQESDAFPYVVSSGWLAERIERAEPNLLVIDVGDLRPYRSAHIPGAIHSFWLETVERDYDYYGTVLNQKGIDSDADDQGKRRDWLRRHGIGRDTHVIAYDRTDGRRAARIVWFLRFLGHEQTSLLDGGLRRWQAESRATTTGEVTPPGVSAEIEVRPSDGFYVATSRLVELLDAGEIDLVDIRTDAERLDSIDGQFDIGVIPGSFHLPWDNPAFNLASEKAAFDPDAARSVIESAGLSADRPIVLYGRFGTDACQMWVVLRSSNFANVVIYDRGWVEWSDTDQRSLPIS